MGLRKARKARFVAVFATMLAAGAFTAVALADNVQVNEVVLGDSVTKAAGGTGNATVRIVANSSPNGDVNGCNPEISEATVTLTSNQTWLEFDNPGSVEITTCGNDGAKTIGYTVSCDAPQAGIATIGTSTSDSAASTLYNEDTNTYTVTVSGTSSSCSTPPQNGAPTVFDPAEDAFGIEGDTLTASGKFTDPDNDTMTLSADNGSVGTFTPNAGGVAGAWNWSLGTNDDVAQATITVTADDGHGHTVTDSFDYRALNADPVLGALTLGGTNCDPVLGFSFSDVGSGDTHTGSISWGDSSAPDSFTTSPVSKSHHYVSAGTYPITVNVADDNGGTDSDSTVSHTVNNIPSTVLQPINYTGRPGVPGMSLFKAGSTIPVKITVANCNGASVGGLLPTVKAVKYDNQADGTDVESSSPANPDPGTQMRYDATAGQYIYNLGTKGQTAGDYKLTISDASFASDVIAYFSLKK
jgi:hypothetical protein